MNDNTTYTGPVNFTAADFIAEVKKSFAEFTGWKFFPKVEITVATIYADRNVLTVTGEASADDLVFDAVVYSDIGKRHGSFYVHANDGYSAYSAFWDMFPEPGTTAMESLAAIVANALADAYEVEVD